MHSGKQTHSGQCRWWSAVYCICWPKAEFPLRQGPRPVFVKTLYTLSVLAQTHAPNSLKLVWTKEKERHKNSSVKFSRSVESDSLQPHESQQARPPYPSPSPRVNSNSHPSSRWCHPAISSPVAPFSSCPQSLPESESFPMSQLFTWGGQSTGVSFSFSIIPSNEHSGLISFSMDWLDLLAVQGTLKSHLQHHSSKASIL